MSKVIYACVVSGVTQHKLQSNLQMAATCAGPGDGQARSSCAPRLAAAGVGPGATLWEVWDLTKPDASCLREFRKI